MILLFGITVLCALFAPSYQQNRSPVFKETLAEKLQGTGIFENTTIGTTIGFVSCEDPDGDLIAYSVLGSPSLRMNFSTGEVSLFLPLDREQSVNSGGSDGEKPNSVTFECFDYEKGADGRNKQISTQRTSVDLVITILDSNDNAPTFTIDSNDGFTFTVRESAPVGTVLKGTISSTDLDTGVNARLDYFNLTCTDADPEPCETFKLDVRPSGTEGKYLANIVLQKPLDYETQFVYIPSMVAIDGPGINVKNTASTGIRIRVIDDQDTDPVFTNQNFNFDVREGFPVGQRVNFSLSARDGDTGARRPVFIEVLDDPNRNALFEVRNIANTSEGIYIGELFVKAPIDREDPSVGSGYTFRAKATEVDSNGTLTTATVIQTFTVNIRDVNDNPPSFSNSSYSITVKEMNQVDAAVQIPNLRIEVNDPDEPTNAQYRMEIVSQSYPAAFGFTPNSQVSGQQNFYLTVNSFQFMDYEVPQYRTQIITLKVVEVLQNGVVGTRSSSATVTVSLSDINDNFPRFDPPSYDASISENAGNFTTITQVFATDDDSGLNGDIIYRLEDRANTLFWINSETGMIRLNGQLDFETQTEYSFLALALDRKGNNATEAPKTSQALVRVRVLDYNDIGPEFTLPVYNARVSENSLSFEGPVQVTARDPSDPNAQITYEIVDGNTPTGSFVLDRNTGILTLRERLNFENTPNQTGIYRLIVEASDNGNPPEKARSVITVTVVDENNHPPVFNPTQYIKTISEAEAPGTEVVTVFATDKDFGSNGEISFRIGTGGRDNFIVTRNGTVRISNNPSLDYDEFKSLTVQIIAVDGGSPQQSATATLLITVTDANNKPPSFEKSLYNTIVDEATPVGTSVLRVSADDIDQGSSLRYSIPASSIQAINMAGAQVGSIFDYDFRKSFQIDPVSGVISVGFGLDRRYVVELSFQVQVEDINQLIGVRTAFSQVTITISGTPNTELYFNQPWTKNSPIYLVPLLESSPIDTEIITLQARDPADDDSVLTDYEEVPGTDIGDYFYITNKTNARGVIPGVVRLKKMLEFESEDRFHSVVVRARKDSRVASATVQIQVTDFNDNRPVFIPSNRYAFSVREGVSENFLVGTIRASDRDSSSFGPIEFTLGGGLNSDDFKLFTTEDDSGVAQLLVNKELDYETRALYNIEVIATDNKFGRGSAIRLDSKAVVEISVLDANDNTPEFTDKERAFSVPETAPLRTRLGQILAADADAGLFGRVTYTLEPFDGGSTTADAGLRLFAIDQNNGLLLTRASLRGLSGGYKLRVFARDGGSPSRSSSIPITIKVQGAEDDDGTPVWQFPINNFVVRHPENTRGPLNVDISASARTPNAVVVYTFAPFRDDYTNFVIDRDTGKINVTEMLDREEQPTYTLVIQARDSLNSTMISRRTLIVELIDQDDNAPSFKKSRYPACPTDFEVPTVFTVIDETPARTIVGEAVACDPDGPGYNNAYYYLYDGNDICRENNRGIFTVHLNGSIENNEILDYEVQSEYLVCVKVESNQVSQPAGRKKRAFDTKRMTNTDTVGYVVIRITDINDNGPSFPTDTLTAVLEALPTEPTLIQVTAVDPDGPVFGRVRYDITATMYHPPEGEPYSLRGAFAIDSNTGEVTINLPSYSDFAQGYFLITITAYDVVNKNLQDTVVVKAIVYRRSQVLRVVLDLPPSQGQALAPRLISELNNRGQPDKEFFFRTVSEHRTKNDIFPTQTDVCFVLVENNHAFESNTGLDALGDSRFREVLNRAEFSTVNTGTCYPLRSSQEGVKWRDLWWVLVAIAIFIFVCVFILIITVVILHNRYKDQMKAQHYMVAQ